MFHQQNDLNRRSFVAGILLAASASVTGCTSEKVTNEIASEELKQKNETGLSKVELQMLEDVKAQASEGTWKYREGYSRPPNITERLTKVEGDLTTTIECINRRRGGFVRCSIERNGSSDILLMVTESFFGNEYGIRSMFNTIKSGKNVIDTTVAQEES